MRNLALAIPTVALVLLSAGLFVIDRELQTQINETIATERIHIGQVRQVREQATKVYTAMLERWIRPLDERATRARQVATRMTELRAASETYNSLEPLSTIEADARTQLTVALALFTNRAQKALINEDGPAAIAEIGEYMATIDKASRKVLSIDAEAGQQSDTRLEVLRKRGSLTIAGLVATGALAIMMASIWWQLKRRAERRYEAAETRRRAQEHSAKLRAQFYAHLSHELRTPIVVIQNLTDKLIEVQLLPTAKRIRQAADELLQGINNVLDCSKLESGASDLKLEAVNVEQVIRRSAHRCEGLIGVKNVRIVIEIADDIPPIVADVVKLHQVVTNLVANAIKFTEVGTATIRALQFDEHSIRIEVNDTGIGISQEAQARIWEPFEQADDSISSKFGGTGLGLSLVKALVTLHEGEVGVNSKSGEGTCFWICLPITRRAIAA